MDALPKILRRLTPYQAAALAFFLLIAGNLPYLCCPPYWDDLMGLHRQALFLARHHFSFCALAASGDFWSGGAWIYKLNWPSLVYGFLYWLLPPHAVHITGHLLSGLLTAGCSGLVFRILRNDGMKPGMALLWSLAMLCEPLFSTQSAGLGQEIMLAFFFTAFSAAFQKNRSGRSFCCLAAAAFIKPAALIPAAAWGTVLGIQFLRERSRTNLKRLITAGILCAGIFLMLLWDSDGAADTAHWNAWDRLQNMLSHFPLLTVLAVAGILGGIRKLVKHGYDAEILLYCCWILFFFAGYCSYSVPLPRYAATLTPVCILLIARTVPKPEIGAIVTLAAGLLMQNGTGYPPLKGAHHHSGEFLERNRQILRQAELDRTMCAFMEKNAGNHPIIAKWPYVQMLAEPGFGYVKHALPAVYCAGIVPADLKNVKKYPDSGLAKLPDAYYIFVCNSFEFFRDFGPPLAPARGDIPVWMPEKDTGYCLIYRKGTR